MFKKIVFQLISIFNFFLNIYILFILLFLNNLEIVGEAFVVISLINVFSYGLSANIRNIYLGNKDSINIKRFLLFRIKIGIIALIFCTIVVYLVISKENIFFHLSLINLTIINWIIEIFIARNEKNNRLNFYHITNTFVFIISYPILLFFNYFEYSIYLIFTYILFTVIIYAKSVKNIIKVKRFNLKPEKININLGISSTLLKTVSNLVWRYFILLIIGKSQSALIFLGFSIGSLYGTLFDVSYGALFLKNFKKYKKLLLNIIYICYLIIAFIILVFISKFSQLSEIELNTLIITTSLSLLGAYSMVFALDIRQNLFEIKNIRNICFKVDIFIYLFNAALIPLLSLVNKEFIVSAYLIASIFCYSVYKATSINAIRKKL